MDEHAHSDDPVVADAAYPASNPTAPADLTATGYHCLGTDPGLYLHDRLGRPSVLCEGTPIRAVLR